MPNVTISLDEGLIKQSRSFAARHKMSLNGLIRELLKKTVMPKYGENWPDDLFSLMDAADGHSRGVGDHCPDT